MNWIGMQRKPAQAEKGKRELAGIGALIGCGREFSKLVNTTWLLFMVAAWPKRRTDEKDVGSGDAAE
jgi:hypothetical protein